MHLSNLVLRHVKNYLIKMTRTTLDFALLNLILIIPWYFILIGSTVVNVTSNFKMLQNTGAELDILSVTNATILLNIHRDKTVIVLIGRN